MVCGRVLAINYSIYLECQVFANKFNLNFNQETFSCYVAGGYLAMEYVVYI